MLVFIFRPLYPELKWRPKTFQDLLKHKLVRLWKATDDDTAVLKVLDNCRGKE